MKLFASLFLLYSALSFCGPHSSTWLGENSKRKISYSSKISLNLNIFDIDSRYRKADLVSTRSRGHAWPLLYGQSSQRYQLSGYSSHFMINYRYFQNSPPISVRPQSKLSAAEKYDLLVGDENFTLTKASWDLGKKVYDKYGDVEGWHGLCHGWTIATLFHKWPKKSIDLVAANGKLITFNPDEIMSLVTLLWAEGVYPLQMHGKRCNSESSRSGECKDIQASQLHQVLVKEMNINKNPIVMDKDKGRVVDNVPIVGYSFRYFNVRRASWRRNQYLNNLNDALTPYDQVHSSYKKGSRSRFTKSLLGISMRVYYNEDLDPKYAQNSKSAYVDYLYDLEINSANRIVGGRWHSDNHPDFLWQSQGRKMVTTRFDSLVQNETWDPRSEAVPEVVRSFAKNTLLSSGVRRKGASSKMRPLYFILKRMLELAQ